MKRFIMAVACIMLAATLGACGAEKSENEGKNENGENSEATEQEKVEREVLRLESKVVDYENGIAIATTEKKYDEKGNLTESMGYDPLGYITSGVSYKYDKDGNVVEYIGYGELGSVIFKEETKYDEDGRMIELIGYNSYGSISYKKVPQYDGDGKETKCVFYDEWAQGRIISENIYDEKGVLTEFIEYDYQGNVERKYKYQYGTNGFVRKMVYDRYNNLVGKIDYEGDIITAEYTYDVNGNTVSGYYYVYDENGNVTEYNEVDNRGKVASSITYTYDANGKLIGGAGREKNGARKYDQTYDEYGNLVKVVGVDTSDGRSTFLYEYVHAYDTKGNVVATEVLIDGVITQYTEYIILEVRK